MVVVVLAAQVVHVAGADEAAAELARDLDDPLVALVLRREAVLLHLEVDVLGPEHVAEVVGVRARLVVTVLEQALAEARGQAACQRDHALREALDQAHVDRRLAALQAVEEARRGELHEVAIAGVVGRQQRQVVALGPARAARGVVVDEVDLTAEDRLDAVLVARLIELDGPVHDAVVGQPERRLLELGGALRQRVDLARTVEQRVLGVDVEMGAAGRAQRRSMLCAEAAEADRLDQDSLRCLRRSRRRRSRRRVRVISDMLCLCGGRVASGSSAGPPCSSTRARNRSTAAASACAISPPSGSPGSAATGPGPDGACASFAVVACSRLPDEPSASSDATVGAKPGAGAGGAAIAGIGVCGITLAGTAGGCAGAGAAASGCSGAGVVEAACKVASRRRAIASASGAEHAERAPLCAAQRVQQVFGPPARRALGLEHAVHLERRTLELGQAGAQDTFGSQQRGPLGDRGLLGLVQLALDAVQADLERLRFALARAEPSAQPLHLRPRLAFDLGTAVFGLDAQALLGVLALRDALQLALERLAWQRLLVPRRRRSVAGRAGHLEPLCSLPSFLLDLAQAVLQAGDVGLQRPHRRLGRLGAQHQRVLARFGGAARPPFSQQVALAAAPAALRGASPPLARRLAALGDHDARKLRRDPDSPGRRARPRSARRTACDRNERGHTSDGRHRRQLRGRQPPAQVPLPPAPDEQPQELVAVAVHARDPTLCARALVTRCGARAAPHRCAWQLPAGAGATRCAGATPAATAATTTR